MQIILTLFKHAWLNFVRSKGLGQKLIESLLVALIMLNFAVSLFLAGALGGELLALRYATSEQLKAAMGLLLMYFLVDVLVRYFFQKFPVMGLKPYLVLNLPRRKVVSSLLWRSLLSFWNLLPWFFAIPLYFSTLRDSGIEFLPYLLGVSALVVANNYITFALVANKWSKSVNLALMLGITLFLYAEFNGYITVAPVLGAWVLPVIAGFQSVLLWLLPLGLAYWLGRHLSAHLNLEQLSAFDRGLKIHSSFGLFGKYGIVGQLVDLELRLVARNKRARQYFITGLIFVLFPLYAFSGDSDPSPEMMLLVAWLVTGMVTLNHAQLLLSWNSLHFDFLLTRGKGVQNMMRAKYYAMCIFCVLPFVLSLPYAFKFPFYAIAAFVMLPMHLSFSVYVYMLVATITALRVDPNEGSLMNMNGFGMVHYLIVIPIALAPVAVYGMSYWAGGTNFALLFTAGLGYLLFALHKPIIGLIVQLFNRSRYRLSATLRNK